MYLELTIFRILAEPFLQIFVEKAWSPISLVQWRKHPLWGTWICSQGPARHRKKNLILLPKPARSQAQQWVWASRLPNQLQSKVHRPHQQDQTEERGAGSISPMQDSRQYTSVRFCFLTNHKGDKFNHIHHHLTCPLVDHVDTVHKIPVSGWTGCSFDADGSDPVPPAHSPCWGHFTDKWWRRWKHSTDSKQSACN